MNLTLQELWMNEEVQVHYTYKSCERKRAVSGVQGTQPLMWAKSTTNEFAFLSISTTNLINLTTAILIIWIFSLCIFDIFDSFSFWLYPTLEGINWKAKAYKVGMVKEKLLLFQGSASALGQPSKAGIPHKLQVQKMAGLACNPAALSTRWWGEACNHILDRSWLEVANYYAIFGYAKAINSLNILFIYHDKKFLATKGPIARNLHQRFIYQNKIPRV